MTPQLITARRPAIQAARLFMAAVLCLLALVASPVRAQDNLSAFVDRNDVAVNDVITLTVRVGALLGTRRPSLEDLNDDFDLLGTTTSSSYSNINGNVQSWTEYRISLKPKSTGTLTIPAFRVEHETTQPITVRVREASQAAAPANDDIFLTTAVDKDSVYVQEQLIYTIRLYYSLRFDQGAQLTSPQVDNAVIQQLGGDQNFQEIVDGIRYDVTERQYVIFPQNSGELTISPIQFSATVGGRGGMNRLLSRSPTATRQINLDSEAHTVTVKPVPASFSGRTWLPARTLELSEEWTGDTDNIDVGDSLTRSVRLVAEGLSSSLLPALDYPELEGLRFYPDQARRDDSANRQGVIGSRSEGAAVVATMPGAFTLPEIRIPWWNTESDRMEVATLPARTVEVTGELMMNTPPLGGGDRRGSASELNELAPPAAQSQPPVLWIGATAMLGLAWLFSSLMWFRSAQQKRALPQGNTPQHAPLTGTTDSPSLKQAWKALELAASKGSDSAMRAALIDWTREWAGATNIRTLAHCRQVFQDDALSSALIALEKRVYGNTGNSGENSATEAAQARQTLLRQLAALPAKRMPERGKADRSSEALPALYPH